MFPLWNRTRGPFPRFDDDHTENLRTFFTTNPELLSFYVWGYPLLPPFECPGLLTRTITYVVNSGLGADSYWVPCRVSYEIYGLFLTRHTPSVVIVLWVIPPGGTLSDTTLRRVFIVFLLVLEFHCLRRIVCVHFCTLSVFLDLQSLSSLTTSFPHHPRQDISHHKIKP